MRIFIDDDQVFLAWQQAQPSGYIVNTTRVPRADYLMLHRATCPHLGRLTGGLRWTKDYIKVCAEEIDELDRWARSHVTGAPRLSPCQVCRP
ncbi:MAG: hypothetical protein M3Q03_21260 [Chloroflexota bacterium]|nr:hypothetical protein [Chloroflexota bacterium]